MTFAIVVVHLSVLILYFLSFSSSPSLVHDTLPLALAYRFRPLPCTWGWPRQISITSHAMKTSACEESVHNRHSFWHNSRVHSSKWEPQIILVVPIMTCLWFGILHFRTPCHSTTRQVPKSLLLVVIKVSLGTWYLTPDCRHLTIEVLQVKLRI